MSPPGRIISVLPARRNGGHTRSSAAAVDRSSTPHSSLLCRAAYVALIMMGLALAGCETRDGGIGTAPMATSPDAGATIENTLSDDLVRPTTLGGPLANLSAAELARFNAGLVEFNEAEEVDEGLGPVFNEAGCFVCHSGPVGGTNGRTETRFGKWENGRFDALAELGGSLLQDHAIGRANKFTFAPEVVPRRANQTALRVTTPLFGLGLVDAVPDAAFLQLARDQARNSPSTRGTANMVTEIATGQVRVGRFGWKAQVPTLHQFSGDAYLNEMGITSPEFPVENAPQGSKFALQFNPVPTLNDDGEGVELFADFMTLLGPPPRGPRTRQTDWGAGVFLQIGCANCHTPTLTTGDSPVPAIAHKSFQPFSDFLLHDMGRLGDGIVQGNARGREMRTAPLWGLRSRPTLLHDGSAKTPEQAILAHAGQGSDARYRFARLDWRARSALIAFLKTL
jgi:CxxC motif-containing protein (DUF1111 family)